MLDYVTLRLNGVGAYHDICDVLQDTYGEFYKTIRRKGTGYADNPLAVLYKIAGTRLKRKYAQKHERANVLSLQVGAGEDEDGQFEVELKADGVDEEQICDRVVAQQMLAIIEGGDKLSAQIFLLRYEHDMKLDDIAKALGLELHTVKNKLYRKIVEMRKIFGVGGEADAQDQERVYYL